MWNSIILVPDRGLFTYFMTESSQTSALILFEDLQVCLIFTKHCVKAHIDLLHFAKLYRARLVFKTILYYQMQNVTFSTLALPGSDTYLL